MKRTQQCPKCQGRKLWMIERFRIPGEYVGGTLLPVTTQLQETGGFLSMSRAEARGHFDLWLCEGCGYSELWASDIAGLREDPANGVRRIDTTHAPSGPFR